MRSNGSYAPQPLRMHAARPGDWQPADCGGESLWHVVKEVLSSTGGKHIPAQLPYSSAVHGAEGPIDQPH